MGALQAVLFVSQSSDLVHDLFVLHAFLLDLVMGWPYGRAAVLLDEARQPPIGQGLPPCLAGGAVLQRLGGEGDLPNHVATLRAGLARAAMHLEEALLVPFELGRRHAGGTRAPPSLSIPTKAPCSRSSSSRAELGGRLVGRQSCHVERFVGVGVADSGDDRLFHQGVLDVARRRGQSCGERCDTERRVEGVGPRVVERLDGAGGRRRPRVRAASRCPSRSRRTRPRRRRPTRRARGLRPGRPRAAGTRSNHLTHPPRARWMTSHVPAQIGADVLAATLHRRHLATQQ